MICACSSWPPETLLQSPQISSSSSLNLASAQLQISPGGEVKGSSVTRMRVCLPEGNCEPSEEVRTVERGAAARRRRRRFQAEECAEFHSHTSVSDDAPI